MTKKVLGDFDLPNEGDIIDQVAAGAEKMRRMKDEVIQLKERTDFVSLLSWLGLEGKENGKGRMYLCPFHDDKNPSLSVDRNKGVWHCFGCGKGGDMVSFIEEYRSTDFKGALVVLRDFHGILPASSTKAYKRREPPKERLNITPVDEPEQAAPNPDKQPSGDPGQLPAVTLDEACEYYHKTLYKNQNALAYLEGRSLNDPELIARFAIGFADGSLTGILSANQKQAFGELGIFRDSGKEHFAGCITFPLFDEAERCVGMYGRIIDPEAKVKHLYLKGEHRGIFNRKASRVYDEIILTEGIIDALSLVKLGFQNVQALYGINGFTAEHLQALKNDRVKTVILGFDNDEPGIKGTETRKADILSEGLGVKVITPQGKDWNEDLLAGVSHEAIREKIEAATRFENKEPEETTGFKVKKTPQAIFFTIDEFTYRIEGAKELYVGDLRITLKTSRDDSHYHDKLDLLSARAREMLFSKLSGYFTLEPKKFEKHFDRILTWFEEERERKFKEQGTTTGEIIITEEDRQLGLTYLTNPAMFDELLRDTEVLGFVGEEVNKLLLYIAASSRKTDDPMSVIVMSESASGKSFLINTVKKLIPPEDVVSTTSLSDQALVYMASNGLLHKFLVMGEAVHSEIIEHQIREMLSDKELSRTVTVKDERTGAMSSKYIWKQVIVSAVMSTTDHALNPENVSRFFIINTDESREQTLAIFAAQNKKYSLGRYNQKACDIPQITRKHHAAQRLLKVVNIVNPFAEMLAFPDLLTRVRRDHDRFMDLIAGICFVRQYQKEPKTARLPNGDELTYIECDLDDYALAHRIMTQVLPVTLSGFPKSAFMLYEAIRKMVRTLAKKQDLKSEEVRITQRMIREETGLNQMHVKRYLRYLTDCEYLLACGSRMRGSKCSYRLFKDEDIRLLDISMLLTPEQMKDKLQNV